MFVLVFDAQKPDVPRRACTSSRCSGRLEHPAVAMQIHELPHVRVRKDVSRNERCSMECVYKST